MPSGLPRFHLFIHLSEEVACDSHDGQVIAARLVTVITAVPGNGGDSCPELMPAVMAPIPFQAPLILSAAEHISAMLPYKT